MFNITDKSKKYQCPSEFGLYKCEETNDCYSVGKKSRFGFGYLVVLLTSVIVLSSVCVVLYNFISSSNTKQKPRLIKNESEPFTEINATFIPYINISYIHEFSNENIGNQTESSDSETKSEEAEPQALEYGSRDLRRYFPESNIPRPFIYENRDPKPTGFQGPSYYNPKIYEDNEAAENKPIRKRVKNIQDIIKLLSNHNEDEDTENSNKKVKLKRDQKKLGPHPKRNSQPFASDPFFPYKPQNPSDINLMATNGFRFAPTIQLDPKKNKHHHQFMEQYPNYERPMDSKEFNYPEQPISVTLDLSQNKRIKKQKPINTPVGFNNLYNQNQYFNPGNRYQPSQQYLNKQPYFKPWNHWNLAPNANRQKIRNGVVQQTIKGQSPMIVHLNLYPKKRKPPIEDTEIEESKIQHNCSDYYDGYNLVQIKNASEFNQLLGHTHHHQALDPIYNGKVTTTTDKDNENMYGLVKDESHPHQLVSKPNVEIQKSIGFTIVNPNFSTDHSNEGDFYSNGESESQWHPIAVPDEENVSVSNARDDRIEGSDKDNHYDGLEVGEVNEGSDETVTLPLPQDMFQKYFNSKPITSKYNSEEWDPNVIRQNPNLINHRASFYDEGTGTKDNI